MRDESMFSFTKYTIKKDRIWQEQVLNCLEMRQGYCLH